MQKSKTSQALEVITTLVFIAFCGIIAVGIYNLATSDTRPQDNTGYNLPKPIDIGISSASSSFVRYYITPPSYLSNSSSALSSAARPSFNYPITIIKRHPKSSWNSSSISSSRSLSSLSRVSSSVSFTRNRRTNLNCKNSTVPCSSL
jgi:hypothetical protein